MDFADYFWLIFVAVLFGGDVIMATVFKKKRWTFSHHVWEWFAIGKNWKENYAGIRWFILAALMVSTTLHFLAGFSAIPIIVSAIAGVWSIYYHYTYERQK